MKIHILYPHLHEQRGGGSSFLQALRVKWREQNAYSDTPQAAEAILFNSHHGILDALRAKRRYPQKTFVQRIDGPMAAYNPGDRRDALVLAANQYLADATIFQSHWSKEQNRARGMPRKDWEAVIHNAASPLFKPPLAPKQLGVKVKLIATSWSIHQNKGFATYTWLDRHLDWSRYEMVFIGNSPVKFKNILQLPPLSKPELVAHLQRADIFIFASLIEACSNTLLEALACRVPVIAFAGSSNTELVGNGGCLFENVEEIPRLLERIIDHHADYQAASKVASLTEISQAYYSFIMTVHTHAKRSHLSLADTARVLSTLLGQRFLR